MDPPKQTAPSRRLETCLLLAVLIAAHPAIDFVVPLAMSRHADDIWPFVLLRQPNQSGCFLGRFRPRPEPEFSDLESEISEILNPKPISPVHPLDS
jgi:hypothetical protein